jgi:hypothetical protein
MYGQGAATSSLDTLPRQNSATAESVPRRADPSSDSETPTWTSGAVPNIGNEGVPTPIVSGASLSKSLPGRRGSAPALSVGTVIYLVSVGLVATAIVGVFFGAGFLLLLHPAAGTVAGSGARDPVIAVRPLEQGPLPPSHSDHRPTDDSLKPVAPEPTVAGLTGATDSLVVPLAPPPVAPEPPPEKNAAAPNSAGLPPAAGSPTGAASSQSAGASEAVSSSLGAPALASSSARLSAPEISELSDHGDALLRTGDIASARLFYERAAAAGDGRAALRLGATFDPAFLGRAGLSNVRGDAAEARLWYNRALDLGAAEAERQLKSVEAKQGR